jgi:SAM-dependent methyltransferase
MIGDEDFVTSLYRALLDREPDAAGLKAHLDALSAGLARDELRNTFLASNEYAARRAAATGIAPQVLYALSPHPIWALDDVAQAPDGTTRVTGWAVGHRDHLSLAEITLNGRRAATLERHHASDIISRMPWFRGNAQRFTATFDGSTEVSEKLLRFSLVRAGILEPFSRWQDKYFPLDDWQQGNYVAPDSERLTRAHGNDSRFHYVMLGSTIANMLAEIVRTYFGKAICEYDDICDWGCSYAPVVQAMKRLAGDSKITGVDTDADAVLWSRESVRHAKFRVLPLLPPSSLAAEQFDLLYATSGAAHPKIGGFEAWRDELHRVVRPGGIALLAVNSPASLAMSSDPPLLPSVDLEPTGGSGSAEGASEVYLPQRLIIQMLSEKFTVRDVVPLANVHQNLAVCERT